MLRAQGLPYDHKRGVPKTKYQGPLKDFLIASGKQLDIKSEPPKQANKKPKVTEDNVGWAKSEKEEENKADVKMEEEAFEEGLAVEDLDQICEQGLVVKKEKSPSSSEEEDQEQEEKVFIKREPDEIKFESENYYEENATEFDYDNYDDHDNANYDDHDNGNYEPKTPAHSPPGISIKQEVVKKKSAYKSPGEEGKGYTCPICGRTLSRSNNNEIQRHIATHSGERCFKCDECGSKFLRIQELTRHKKIHTGDCRFRCNICKAGFKAQIALRAHKSSIHNDQTMLDSESDVWPFSCNQCDSRFQKATAFGKHMKLLHGVGNPFICDKCGMGMSTNDNLKRHALSAHSDMKPFNCEECGKMFGQKSQLMRHQLEHAKANGSLTLEQEKMLREQSEKQICNLCGKELSCKVTLQRHMRLHDANGGKCHTCEECGKAYSDKRNLSDHIDIVHRHFKKFSCPICGRQFGRRANFQVHMKNSH